MKIKLEYPYNTIWEKGYIVSSQGRNTVILYNSHSNRSSVSLARYKMAVYLKRFLLKEEHVDHKDGNKINDNINNLQILSLVDNNRKTHSVNRAELTCPVCAIKFTPKRNQFWKKERCCSRKCGTIKAAKTKAIKKETNHGRM